MGDVIDLYSRRLREESAREYDRSIDYFVECIMQENVLDACERYYPEHYQHLLILATNAARINTQFYSYELRKFYPLPIGDPDKQERLLATNNYHKHLSAYYAKSLAKNRYGFWRHPAFAEYCRGVMASGPEYLQTEELMALFPPQTFAGLARHLLG